MTEEIQVKKQLNWRELLPLVLVIAIVPLLFRLTWHKYSPTEYTVYPGAGFYDLYSWVKAQTLMALTALSLVVFIYHIKTKQITLQKNAYMKLTAIYAITIIASTVTSDYDVVYLGLVDRFEGMWVLLCYLTLFIMCMHYGRRERITKIFIHAFFVSVLILGIIGFMQFAGHDPYTKGILRYMAYPVEAWDTLPQQVKTSFQSGIVASLYNPNFMGSYAAMAVLMSLGYVIKEQSKKKRAFYLAFNLMAVAMLIGSGSSAGLVGLIGGLTVMILMSANEFKQGRKKAFLLFLAWMGVALLVKALFERVYSRNIFEQDALTLLVYLPYFAVAAYAYTFIYKKRSGKAGISVITVAYMVVVLTLAGLLFNPIQNATSMVHSGQSIEEAEAAVYAKEKLKSVEVTDDEIRIEEENGRQILFQVTPEELKAYDWEGNDLGLEMLRDGRYRVADQAYSDFELSIQHIDNMPELYVYAVVPKYDIWTLITAAGLKFKGTNHLAAEIDYPDHWGFEGRERFLGERGYIWSRTFPILKDHLILGAGPDAYVFEFPQHDMITKHNVRYPVYMVIDKPHNWYLQMGVNTGLISVLVVLAMGTLLLIQGIKKHLINSQAYGITVPLIAAVMSYAAAGFFNDSIVSVAPVFWMLFGLAAGAVQGFEEVVAEEMDDKLLSEQEEQE